MPPNAHEIAAALRGALRLARLDAGGLALFDRTLTGFWRSFFAAVIAAPAHLFLLVITPEVPPDVPIGRAIAVESIAYAIRWLAYPFAMLLVVDLLRRRERFFDYMVAYNWSNVPQIFLLTLVTAVGAALPDPLGPLLSALALLSILIYEWFVAKVGLLVSGPTAVTLVLLDLMLGVSISLVTSALLHP